MKARELHIAAILLVVGLVFGILGCATPEPATTTSSSTTAAPKTLPIGVLAPITGPAAQWGIATQRSAELAADDINAAGGVKAGNDTYMLKVIPYDHKMVATEAVAAANKLIFQDNVRYISCLGSAPTLAAQAVTEPNKTLTMISGYAAGLIDKTKAYAFRGQYAGREACEGMYGYVVNNMKEIKEVALVGNDDDTGKASTKQSEDVATANGLKVVAKESCPRGTTDFYPLIIKILPANPDLIDVDSIAPADCALFIKQAREKGYKGVIMANSSNDIPAIVKIAGAEAAEGYMQEGLNYASAIATPQQRQLYESYLKKYDAPWDPLCGNLYQFVIAFKAGMEAAQTVDSEKVAAAIPGTKFQSLGIDLSWGGTQRYGINHQIVSPVYVSGVKGGEQYSLGKYTPPVP